MSVYCVAKLASRPFGERVLISASFSIHSAPETNVNRRQFSCNSFTCAGRSTGFSSREKQTEDYWRAAREDEGAQGCACVHARSRILVDGRGGSRKPHVDLPRVQGAAIVCSWPTIPAMGGFTVEISTDKGVKGYGKGGPAGGAIVEEASDEAADERRSVQHRADLGHHVAIHDVLRPRRRCD